MTAAAIIALLAELAKAFGLTPAEVISWAKQRHPALSDPPPPDAEDSLGAEAEVLIEKRWPTPREDAELREGTLENVANTMRVANALADRSREDTESSARTNRMRTQKPDPEDDKPPPAA